MTHGEGDCLLWPKPASLFGEQSLALRRRGQSGLSPFAKFAVCGDVETGLVKGTPYSVPSHNLTQIM